jgi:RNA polymerase sigma factor (sigma-70 family)
LKITPKKKNNYISDLVPGNAKDFWEFYRKNSKAVEDIFTAQVFRVAPCLNSFDRDDLHQDVLTRMYRCNVLAQYNSNRAAFNTYLTGRIHGYIRHWVKNKKHSWKKNGEQYYYTQVRVRSLNGWGVASEDISLDDLVERPQDFDEQYDFHERIEILRKVTPPTLQGLLNLFYVGLSKEDIAKSFKATVAAVTSNVDKIAKLSRKFMKTNNQQLMLVESNNERN